MIEALKSMFGIGAKADLAQLVKEGAMIVDVRTGNEYAGGHIKGSINIPLDQLQNNLGKIHKNKVVITCCASGMRSAAAKNLLISKGYTQVYNGGGWSSLKAKL
jgi:phage shock protein E